MRYSLDTFHFMGRNTTTTPIWNKSTAWFSLRERLFPFKCGKWAAKCWTWCLLSLVTQYDVVNWRKIDKGLTHKMLFIVSVATKHPLLLDFNTMNLIQAICLNFNLFQGMEMYWGLMLRKRSAISHFPLVIYWKFEYSGRKKGRKKKDRKKGNKEKEG